MITNRTIGQRISTIAVLFLPCAPLFAQNDDFPIVPDDIEVTLFAQEPIVRNPCAITFDAKGRLCVGMGPQYRSPTLETPPDSVWFVVDQNGDGIADARKQFATGFNAIQGLAWKGDWLWIANSPELTRVRDTDGDDVADEYVRVFTDLGNLEHALHGLNFGPDGRLYMSKGNSKGLTILPDRLAPSPFLELWGIKLPAGTPEPKPITFTQKTYLKSYQDPRDDWGISGGILRCEDDGSNLEIVSRGFRNPWDISFDDQFDWLGTDNDQTMGDKIFTPFFGSHFGWGHSWSYDWKGDQHLPTAPSSGPLFEGSGAGVIFSAIQGYPEKYKNVFLISDWLNREVLIYKSKWDGAWRKADRDKLEVLAHAEGGRSMSMSSGRSFDPVDIEIGPDSTIWISSWGRQYGAHYKDGKLANEGRIYRFWPKDFNPNTRQRNPRLLSDWSIGQLIADLGSQLPVWRTNAQNELIRRGSNALSSLLDVLDNSETSTLLETWTIWTIGRIAPSRAWFDGNINQKIQSLRLRAFHKSADSRVLQSLSDPEPRVRLEAVLALRQSGLSNNASSLIKLAASETDRIVYYAAWGALMHLLSIEERKKLLIDKQDGIRLAALLGLLEEDVLTDAEIKFYTKDPNSKIAKLANRRLDGKFDFEHRGRPLTATSSLRNKKPLVIPFTNIVANTNHPYRAALMQAGVPSYTDRNYLLTKVPPELQGLTFLQTACSDADAKTGITVTLNLKYPSTVYLIDDARAESLPTWARKKWKPTNLVIEGNNPKLMNVYEAEFPAGPLVLGTSRDGIKARKGNYIVAVRPHLLSPSRAVASEKNILTLISKADPERGRDLFFSAQGANCAACHQVNRSGNNHAPDLSEIGSRVDTKTLIKSIIDPSASIVEGFSTKVISTKDGNTYSGITLGETSRYITMAMTGGVTVKIDRRKIQHQKSMAISAMPAGYATMMTSQQIADVVAYLKTLRKPNPTLRPNDKFVFHRQDNQLQLFLGNTEIATYLIEHAQLTRRAFVNVRTPSGHLVTRNFPPRTPEDIDPGNKSKKGIIHPVMHPGIWMSFGWISGNDYWRLQSKVQFEKFLKQPESGKGQASFATRDRYLNQNGTETICLQDTTYHFKLVNEGILLEWDCIFYNDTRDFAFGDQEESGLAIRIASPLRVKGGRGGIVNDRGEKNGAATWGKHFKWIDYSGEIKGKQIGVLVIPHPENPRNCWSHSRDYGVIAYNPFPKQPKERRKPYVITPIKKGERYRLRYSILIHETDAKKFIPEKLANRIQNAMD
ncbi:MAG: PmoA family protein [Verrucomicrobiales bacterium]|nr:PmoA family protein [Verrucomicrobiales bacterium]